jgi:DNA modification methylase
MIPIFFYLFTVENQIVFDPMMGTGTTGIAVLKLKRQFLGNRKRYGNI